MKVEISICEKQHFNVILRCLNSEEAVIMANEETDTWRTISEII